MAILKKGSKGKPVEELQKQLNKLGARPKLKVDGIFGPLTLAAVKVFQKKIELKSDGDAGPLTLAGLKFGGKLPKMTVQDYKDRYKFLGEGFASNRKNYASYQVIGKEIKALCERTEIDQAVAIFFENYKHYENVAKLCQQLIAKQDEFKKELLADPAKAAKLVKECETLDKQVETIGNTKIVPNIDKAAKGLSSFRPKLEGAMKTIKSELGKIDKQKENW